MSKNIIGSVQRDNFVLKYVIEGQGLPTLVIGSALYYPKSFSQNLREHFQMAFIDWRGFAESTVEKHDTTTTLNTFLEDIECMRQKMGFERCIVIGHSAHALLALEYAKKYKEHVSHVIMIGISPNLSSDMAKLAQQNWEESACLKRKEAFENRIKEFPDVELLQLSPSERFVAWYVRRDPQAWYDYDFKSNFLWKDIYPNMPMFDYLYGVALRDLDITKALNNFDIPVFLALGKFDYIIAPPSSWDSVQTKFQDLTIRVFDKSGHSPQYEESNLFDQEICTWISECK